MEDAGKDSPRSPGERLEALEADVRSLRRYAGFDFLVGDPTSWVEDFLTKVDSISLQEVIRQLPRDHLATTFYGFSIEAMAKVKSAVSKRTWEDLIEVWQSGHVQKIPERHNQLARVAMQLNEMGMIVLRGKGEPNFTAIEELVLENDFAAARSEEFAAAQKWIAEIRASL